MTLSQTILRFLVLVAVWGSGSWSLLQAQESHTMTLEEAIAYGLKHHKNIENARFDEYIAGLRVKETLASGYPQLSGSVDPQAFLQLPTTILPGEFQPQQEIINVRRADGGVQPIAVPQVDPETGEPITGDPVEAVFGFPIQFSAGVTLNQMLFDGSFFVGVKAARTFRELSHKQLNRTREQTAVAISQAYYQALIAQKRGSIVEANIERVEKLFRETEGLYQEGFAEKLDVDRLRINLNNLYLEKQKIARTVELSRYLLKFQMGMPITDELTLEADIDELARPEEPELPGLSEVDLTQRIDYSLLQSQREMEQHNLRRIQMGYLPSIYFFTNYQYQYQGEPNDETDAALDLTGIWFPVAVSGLSINVPIFDGLQKHRQVQQSRLELRKIENQFTMWEQGAQLEYVQATTELENAYASLQSTEQTRELANQVYETTRIKYKEGVGSSLEVNEAESQLKEAEANYLSALLEYLLARNELERARGDFRRYHE